MLSIRLITAGGEDYYINLAAEDYYLEGGEPPGKLVGGGAEALDLASAVAPKVFRRLFRGYHPTTGAALVQNAGHSDRQCAWDFTFCCPKSVSIVWSVVPTVVRLLIQQFQQLAVEATLRYAEQNLVFCRTGKGGTALRQAGLVIATFEHGTSRLLQAHLHTHAIVMNLGVTADSKTHAICSKNLFRYKKVLGAYYRAYLAHLLETQLGFTLIRKADSFEIEGVPQDLIDAHSLRRQEIQAYLRKHNLAGAEAAADAAVRTRRVKKDVPPRSKLLERWREINRTLGFTEASVAALQHAQSRNLANDLPRAIAAAQRAIATRYSHFSFRQFLFETLLEAPKWGIPPEIVPQAVQQHLDTADDIVRLREVSEELHYTTRAILQQEDRLLRLVARLDEAPGPKVKQHRVDKVLARAGILRPDQIQAVRYLTQGEGRLRIVCGKAGSGKSTILRVARTAWIKQGYTVIGAAYTGKAARVLHNASGIDTETIHRRLGDYKISPMQVVKHHLRQLARAARGKCTFRLHKPKPIKIDSKTIVVVDEAGMVNTRHFQILLQRVHKGGGTLVLLGDPHQLPPVEGGAPFQSICRRTGCATLTTITRQQDAWAREAVELFATGKPAKALQMYADHRLITVREDRDEALRALVFDWTAVGLTTPERAAVLVATNHESEIVNRACQQQRLQAGCLNSLDYLEIRDVDVAKGITYRNRAHVGDRILFTRNDRRYGVENGAVGTVIALNRMPFAKKIAVNIDDGRRVVIPVAKFPHMRLGYAMTTHKAQGITVPEVFVLATRPDSTQNLPVSYVQASRSIRDTHFYTDKAMMDEYLEEIEDSRLVRLMSQVPDLTLATDLLPDDSQGLQTPEPSGGFPSTSRSSQKTKKSSRKRPRPDQRRLRKSPRRFQEDQTYSMAQVEAIERLRKLPRPQTADIHWHSLDLPPVPRPQPNPLSAELLGTEYLELCNADLTLPSDISSTVPAELILDAHFLDSALQSEVRHYEEELERMQQEQLEQLRRQQEAARQQAAAAAAVDSWESPLSPTPASPGTPSSSMPCCPSSSTYDVHPALAFPTFDQQSYLATGAAQTQWAYNNQPTITTVVACNTQFNSHEVTSIQRTVSS